MEDFDPDSSLAETPQQNNKLAIIAIAVGVIGIALGLFGMMKAMGSASAMDALQAQIENAPDKTPEIEASIKDIEDRLVKLGSEFVKLTKQDRQIREETQKAFDSVSSEIRNNRGQLNEMTAKFTEMTEKLENWTPQSRASVSSQASGSVESSTSDTLESAPDGLYSIKSGDTLSKIAQNHGVTLQALQNANPGINPRRLKIGQKIVIPEN